MKQKNSPLSTVNSKLIRNSTAEFLIFTAQSGEENIEVRYEDETIWLTQKLMATLFDVTVPTINEHLKNIFSSGELEQDSVIRKFRTTASDGKQYNINFYNELAEDRAKRLDLFLEFDEREILRGSGKVTAEIARDFAESKYEKYRIVQDRLFESDFDRVVKQIEAETQDTTDKPETIKQLEDAAKRILDKQ
ncbi:MAG: phosphoribosylaminoimidazolesuccinocarboxamide synthase [Thermodesulfobacteriota bacterium]|nr:MAG: phosphoribosylaminoimidazolesuccinocarboxamide synthase [Thermodesulfobacteriota bacterium]